MRRMTRDDLGVVFAIEQAVQAYPWTLGNFADALESGYLGYVDETESGEISGYAILILAAGEAELLNIGIKTARQRLGLGRAMLREILNIAWSVGVRRVFLEVRSSNIAAISLYSSAGFSKIGRRRGYYRNAEGSEDAIVMACEPTGEAHG